MSRATSAARAVPRAGTLALAAGLAAIALPAWGLVLRDASSASMVMPGASPSLGEGARFTAQWGVMMAAMMLPSAAPMILLYRTVSRRLSAGGDRVVPVALFTAVYLAAWLLLGVPIYLASVGLAAAAARWPWVGAAVPYAIAGTLAAAGAYQFTAAKRACLRHCEAPLAFLMRRWRSGYAATLRLAAQHAAYCVGCCWGLMLILVAAGAMSLAWVVAITVAVFAEKVLPHGGRTARAVGVMLVALAALVTFRPQVARTLRGPEGPMGHGMEQPMHMRMPMR